MGAGPKGKGKEKEPRERKKPGRIPTSCAECRRLKLKCDKSYRRRRERSCDNCVLDFHSEASYQVPCAKCVSRGCGSICPDGALTPGKGNRLILAGTEELHKRNDQLAARNRELEGALRTLQEGVSDEPHPLLRTDVLRMNFLQGSSSGPSTSSSSKSPSTSRITPPRLSDSMEIRLEQERSLVDSFGTLTLGRGGDSKHFGRTARPEHLLNDSRRMSPPTLPRISQKIIDVAFPATTTPDERLVAEILDFLPTRAEALYLCDVYLEYGKFLYDPLPRNELFDEIFTSVYRTEHLGTIEHYHALSLLFIVFAIATLLDPKGQSHSPEAHEYYYLSRTTLNISQPFRETTLAAIHTFIHMAQYLELSDSDTDAPDSAWMNMGHAIRLGYSIGLHLDGNRWKLHDDLVQRRNDIFWRLFVSDTWVSLRIGRPVSISKVHVDCPCPRGMESTPTSETRPGHDFHSWHTQYTLLLHSVMESALGPKQPVYSAILDFDRKIRDFHVPPQWRMPPEEEATPPPREVSMYRWLVLSVKEIALLNLHRSYLGAALQESSSELHRHRYLPSVVAIFRSAWRIIHGLASTWRAIPTFLSRITLAWSHGLSAAIVLCMLVTRSPSSHLSVPVLEELDSLTSLFHSASSSCRSAAKLYPTVQTLRRKAREVIELPHARPYYHQDDASLSITPLELDRLNGRTFLFSEHPSTTSTTEAGSRATSVTISDIAEQHNTSATSSSSSFQSTSAADNENLHSTLVQDLSEFVARSSVPSVPPMSFYDHPSSAPMPPAPSRPMTLTLPHPPEIQPPPQPRLQTQSQHQHHTQTSPYQQASRETGIDQSKFLLQPLQALPQMPYFNQPMNMGFGSGFQSGFQPMTFGGPIALDSSWGGFVEQLGF